MLRGACYLRVSTDEQIEFSPDAQLKAIQHYCLQNNIALDREHIYKDEGISGRKADKRPGFQDMIKHAKKKEFDVILVHKFDRFARSREDSVVYKSLLKKECNIKVVSITESIEDDKFSVILEAMLEAMAEYYSLNLSDEVKKGMTEKAERGGWQTYAPFGYRIENKKLQIIEEQANAVKMLFNDFANGTGYLQLAKKINSLGFRTRFGNKFENRTIEYILTNPVYKGYSRWTPTGKVRGHNSPDTIIAKSEHEPIISEEEFDNIQEIIKARKQIHRKNFKGVNPVNLHWLNGLVRCSNCGNTLVSNNGRLRCNGYCKGTCSTPQTVKREYIEESILEQIKEDFTKQISPVERIKVISDNPASLYISQLQKLPEKLSRAKEAYINGIDSLEEYKLNKANLEKQKAELENKIKEVSQKQVSTASDFNKVLETLYEKLTSDKVTMQEKFNLSHIFIDTIIYDKATNSLHLSYKYQV